MNRPQSEPLHELQVAAVTAESLSADLDSSRRKQLRSGQRRGQREIKTVSRRRKQLRPAQPQT